MTYYDCLSELSGSMRVAPIFLPPFSGVPNHLAQAKYPRHGLPGVADLG